MVRFSVRTYQGMHDTGYKCFPLVPPEDVLPSHSSGSTIPAPTKYCVCRFDAKAVSDLPVDLSNRTRRNRLFRTQLYRLKRPSRMFCRGGGGYCVPGVWVQGMETSSVCVRAKVVRKHMHTTRGRFVSRLALQCVSGSLIHHAKDCLLYTSPSPRD